MAMAERGHKLWEPSSETIDRSAISTYMRWLAAERGVETGDYHELWRWSVDDLDGFWRSIWDHFGVRSERDPGPALAEDRMPGARWFPGARLNWAEHCLRLDGRSDDDIVVIARSQARERIALTAAQLRDEVARVRGGLLRLGVRRGDRVAAYLPNVPEAAIGLLATASIGAIWSSCAPEFGTRSVVDRWSQIEPSVLLTIDGYRYGTRAVDRSAEVAAIRSALPSLRHTVVLPYLDSEQIGRAHV